MIKDVGEVGVELQMDALRNHDGLPYAHVHVPIRLASQNSRTATITSVNSQNGVPEAVIDCCWVLEHVRRRLAEKSRAKVRTGWNRRIVVARTASDARAAHVDCVFKRRENTSNA